MEFRSKGTNRKTGGKNGTKALTPQLPNSPTLDSFEVCDPAYSLCPDCAKALRENTCPKMKEFEKRKKK